MSTWVLLLALAVVSTVMPIFCLTTGLSKLGAAKAAIVGTVEPVLTTILAMIFLGEQMQPLQACRRGAYPRQRGIAANSTSKSTVHLRLKPSLMSAHKNDPIIPMLYFDGLNSYG